MWRMAFMFSQRPITASVGIVVKAVAAIVLMDSKKKITVYWSGDKESAFALYKVLLSGEYDVVSLFAIVHREDGRAGLYGVDETLIEQQARQIRIPLRKLYIDHWEDTRSYAQTLQAFYKKCVNEGVEAVVFGDIIQNEQRALHEDQARTAGLEAMFPLSQINTRVLFEDFIYLGFKAILSAADTAYFTEEQMGQTLDIDFPDKLAPGVDPCGVNGEFHVFVYDGPIFKRPVTFRAGEVLKRQFALHHREDHPDTNESSFWIQDIQPTVS
jgi:uncharacterized protein (TIGR00290 family)